MPYPSAHSAQPDPGIYTERQRLACRKAMARRKPMARRKSQEGNDSRKGNACLQEGNDSQQRCIGICLYAGNLVGTGVFLQRSIPAGNKKGQPFQSLLIVRLPSFNLLLWLFSPSALQPFSPLALSSVWLFGSSDCFGCFGVPAVFSPGSGCPCFRNPGLRLVSEHVFRRHVFDFTESL